MTDTEKKSIDVTLDLIGRSIKKFREIEKIKGEKFNLFNILDRRNDEVKTHSAFISELLNPKGSHLLDEKFLSLFIEMLNRKKASNCDWENADVPDSNKLKNVIVECEKDIGKVNINNGGRLDILISNDIFQICIENKIYASDQSLQLERYRIYIDRIPKQNKILIYLTLNGENSKESKLQSGKDYYSLSYKKDILDWLEMCYKESTDIPIIRESIKQYIILIRSLTNQVSTIEMKNEIHQIILSNIINSEKIAQEFYNAIDKVSDELKVQIKDLLLKKNIISESELISLKNNNERFSTIWLRVSKEDRIFFGIESFSGKGHREGSLFIGQVDFNRSVENVKFKYHIWIDGTIEKIWDKYELYSKLQEYSNGMETTKYNIANEVVTKIAEYISRHYNK